MTETITGTGMSPLEILLVLGAAVLVLARWLPAVARGPVTLAAAATAALSAAVSIVLGLRWQMVPVVAAAAIALGFAAVPLLRQRAGRTVRRAPRWLALPGSAACLALLAVGPVAAWALPEPAFPEPSGRYAVGTTVLEWTDSGRPETFTAEPDDHRSVVVQLWYPACRGTRNPPHSA
ncbi:hypothetical protein E1193_11855 [Micromonospora sp. KC606]|uniref:hypothetical protein n=1 Tax=Micromonospora sp. KC606 TaxID=2530379 RepID=UPI0010537BE0|nr:hypothetical protein [Micromonospora sp. KC606]TDC82433.1 hypothetical protein E1193_11855 [Micromonospora sp. KC606]